MRPRITGLEADEPRGSFQIRRSAFTESGFRALSCFCQPLCSASPPEQTQSAAVAVKAINRSAHAMRIVTRIVECSHETRDCHAAGGMSPHGCRRQATTAGRRRQGHYAKALQHLPRSAGRAREAALGRRLERDCGRHGPARGQGHGRRILRSDPVPDEVCQGAAQGQREYGRREDHRDRFGVFEQRGGSDRAGPGEGQFQIDRRFEESTGTRWRKDRFAEKPVGVLAPPYCFPIEVVAYFLWRNNMNEKADVWQGTLALMVLKTLETLGPLHGYGIARRIEQTSGNLLALNYGTLYPALLKLEQEGSISSAWGVSDNNRKAKFYKLTRAGHKQLEQEAREWEQATTILARFLTPGEGQA